MTNEIVNLDAVCAQFGYCIVQKAQEKGKVENVVTKSLGVLQEQGVYAFFLFLDYYKGRNEGKGAAEFVREHTLRMLKKQKILESPEYKDLQTLTENLDNLLLARELLEQTLIYARYHAKALGEEKKKDQETEETAT